LYGANHATLKTIIVRVAIKLFLYLSVQGDGLMNDAHPVSLDIARIITGDCARNRDDNRGQTVYEAGCQMISQVKCYSGIAIRGLMQMPNVRLADQPGGECSGSDRNGIGYDDIAVPALQHYCDPHGSGQTLKGPKDTAGKRFSPQFPPPGITHYPPFDIQLVELFEEWTFFWHEHQALDT
jgi:hypothetical protein